jgi:hypothetical protein
MRNVTVDQLQKLRTITDILIKVQSVKKHDKELVAKLTELCKQEAEILKTL